MSTKKAFPDPMRGTERSMDNCNPNDLSKGMDLRDYFAAKAMQAFISNNDPFNEKHISDASYLMADEMMKQRLKE